MNDHPDTWVPDETPTYLFSPLKNNLTISLLDDSNKEITITVPSMEIVTVPKYREELVKRRIVDEIINERNVGYISPEQRLELEKEVYVDLHE